MAHVVVRGDNLIESAITRRSAENFSSSGQYGQRGSDRGDRR